MISRRIFVAMGAGAATGEAKAAFAPGYCRTLGKPATAKDINEFQEVIFACDSHERKVYVAGAGLPVLLMHEINGLSPDCIALAKDLVTTGFRVYMPLLFGNAGTDNVLVGAIESCLGSQFNCRTPLRGSPVLNWLDGLIANLIEPEGGNKTGIGVLGMCLTGGFPVALMRHHSVTAVVLSQPALPLGSTAKAQGDIGLPPDYITEAQKRTDVKILGLRFECDNICTETRFDYLRRIFPRQFTGQEVPCMTHKSLTHPEHAVLTSGHEAHPEAFRQVVDFFREEIHPPIPIR